MKKVIGIALCVTLMLSQNIAFADRNADRKNVISQQIGQNEGTKKGLPDEIVNKLNGYLVIKTNDNTIYADGKIKYTDSTAFYENGKFFLPAGITAEYFDKKLVWSDSERTVKLGETIIHPSEFSKIVNDRTMIECDTIAKYLGALVSYKDEETVILGKNIMMQDTVDEIVSALRNKFYVTNDTTAKGDGSFANPYGGLDAAVKGIRKHIANGMNTDITVYFRGGLYTQDNTVVFTPEDSGKNGYTITYKSYPGETAEIVAAKEITGWKKQNNGIYAAKVDAKNTVNVMFENDMFAYKARYPNLDGGEFRDHYLTSAGYDKNNTNKFYFNSTDLPYIKDTSGLQVSMFGGGEDGNRNWYSETKNATIDYREHSLQISWLETYVMGKGSRYFIQGCKELLDAKGEFCYNEVNKEIYYKPYNDDINAQTIIYGTANAPFVLEGTKQNPVKNIAFEDLKIGKTNTISEIRPGRTESITFKNVENCSVNNCEILFTGGCGIALYNAKNCNIIGNDVHDTGDTGVYIDCPDNYGVVEYTGNKIENNYIHNVGLIHREASGIMLRNSDYGTVRHNLIKGAPRMGILFTSEYLPENLVGSVIRGILVDRDNQFDFRNTIGNIVEYNDVSDILTDSQDGGAIYCYGTGKGNVVNNNYVHDFNVHFSMGYAIYSDDQSSYTNYSNNIVDNVQTDKQAGGKLYAAQINKGVGSSVKNSFFINNNALRGAYSTETKLCDEHNNITYMNNITMNSSDQLHGQWEWFNDRFKLCDYNLYYNDSGKYLIYNNSKAKTFEEWKKIDTDNGYMDNNSLAGVNPDFVDYNNRDYRLKYDSCAYSLGIKDINQRDIGITEEFKFADREEELKTLFLETSTSGLSANVRVKAGQSSIIYPKARTITGFFANLDNAQIEYASANSDIASVDSNGKITANNKGVTEITVKVTKNDKTIKSNLFVIVDDDFEAVDVRITKDISDINSTTSVIAVAKSKSGNTIPVDNITYKSSNEAVATVDENGIIKTLEPGNATISATISLNGVEKSSNAQLTVLNGVLDKININADKFDAILVGEKVKTDFEAWLTTGVKVDPSTVNVEYTSDDESILTIDNDGIMHGIKEGRTNINITLEKNGFRKSLLKPVSVFNTYSGTLANGFKEINFGTSHGYADFRNDGSILIRSTGDDFYGNADDGYYLYKDISSDNAEIEIDIKSILQTSSNTAVGISIRESATPESRNYTIRALADGRVISVWRDKTNGESGYASHGSGQMPIKLKIEKKAGTITSYVDFGKGYVQAYTKKMDFKEYTAGVPVFSQYDLSTEAVLNDLTITEGMK